MRVGTNEAIVLCNIIDEYEGFLKDLSDTIGRNDFYGFMEDIKTLSEGRLLLGHKNTKEFYKRNKNVIETITNDSYINVFLISAYTRKMYDGLNDLYEYITFYKKEIDTIKSVLLKLRDLGFTYFEFDEGLDFSMDTYLADPTFTRNQELVFVDNIKIIPTCDDEILYQSDLTDYKVTLHVNHDSTISKFGNTIILNNLVFDPKRLPDKLDRFHTFDEICLLKRNMEGYESVIKDSIDLNLGVNGLTLEYKKLSKIIERLNIIKSKEELIEILKMLESNINDLKNYVALFDEEIIEENESITKDTLEKEKSLYKARMQSGNTDWC